jgi:glucosylceramidase
MTSKTGEVLVRAKVLRSGDTWVWRARVQRNQWVTIARTSRTVREFRVNVPRKNRYTRAVSSAERVRVVDKSLGPRVWDTWVTSPYDPQRRLVAGPVSTASPSLTLAVDTQRQFQSWKGVGAALTDASVEHLNKSREAVELLFDPNAAAGARLNLVRLPLSATDFSRSGWTYGWNDDAMTLAAPPEAVAAVDLLTASIAPLADELAVVASPWTAPAYMKTSGVLNGGALEDAHLESYGRMLVAQADWLRARGVPLTAITLGNEPMHSASGWNGYPTMTMSPTQMAVLAVGVRPRLASEVGLWAVDHNWEHRAIYEEVLARAPGVFDAAAFHCYGGSPVAMDGLAVPPIITECTGTTDSFEGTFRWDAVNLVVEAVKAGSTGLILWNLALDEDNGPRLGGCSTCRGLLTVASSAASIVENPEFFTLAHLSRAADPGARRLGVDDILGMPYAAFRNEDNTVGVVGHNDTGRRQVVQVSINGLAAGPSLTVEPGELFTFRAQ